MEPRRWLSWTGFLLVTMMAAGFVMDFAIIATTSGDPLVHAATVSHDLTRAGSSVLWRVETWTYCLMAVPATLFLFAAWRALEGSRKQPLAFGGILLLAVFWATHTLHNIAMLVVVGSLAPGYVAGAADAVAIEASARALIGLADALNPFVGLGLPFLALGALLVGLASVGDPGRKPWEGWALLAVSGLVTLGALQLVSPVFLAASLLGWVLHMAWIASISGRPAAVGTEERVTPNATGTP